MVDFKDLTTKETVLGGLFVLGLMVLVMRKVLNIFGFDIVRKNGNGKPSAADLGATYLTREKHADLCLIRGLETQSYIAKELKKHTDEIIEAINADRCKVKP